LTIVGEPMHCLIAPHEIAASVVVAAGDAFRSGADQALLYRSSVVLDREGDFQRIEARTRGIQQTALVVLVLTGGAIVRMVSKPDSESASASSWHWSRTRCWVARVPLRSAR